MFKLTPHNKLHINNILCTHITKLQLHSLFILQIHEAKNEKKNSYAVILFFKSAFLCGIQFFFFNSLLFQRTLTLTQN